MHPIKKAFLRATGYWLHKAKTLPIGTDLAVDLGQRLKLPPLKVIFDVGANVGQSVKFFRGISPGARIYAFEPVRETFEGLVQNCADDPLCVLENIALGRISDTRVIRLFEGVSELNSIDPERMNSAENAKEETISVLTLDEYVSTRGIDSIDLLKIDTEGHELSVLDGGRDVLTSGLVSMIYSEVGFMNTDQRHTAFSDLNRFLEDHAYHFVGLYDLSLNSWMAGDYYGNALFVRSDVLRHSAFRSATHPTIP
jgi:FkbM family methyltransferase